MCFSQSLCSLLLSHNSMGWASLLLYLSSLWRCPDSIASVIFQMYAYLYLSIYIHIYIYIEGENYNKTQTYQLISTDILSCVTLVAQSRPILCHPMDCSPPGSYVHGILQAIILEWVAIPFSRESSWPRNWTWVSWIAGGRFLTVWAIREAVFPLYF